MATYMVACTITLTPSLGRQTYHQPSGLSAKAVPRTPQFGGPSERTKILFVEYHPATLPTTTPITPLTTLKETLHTLSHDKSTAPPLRLFIVEDLSQQVIELLGSRFDIDRLFFRP